MLLSDPADHWKVLSRLLAARHVAGARMQDAHIAALCFCHGVSEVLSADRDFARFPDLKTQCGLFPNRTMLTGLKGRMAVAQELAAPVASARPL